MVSVNNASSSGPSDGNLPISGADGEGTAAAEPTATPPQLSVVLSLSLGSLAVVFLGAGSLAGGAVALVGVSLLASALVVVSTRLSVLAGGAFVLALVVAGIMGGSAAPLVGGTILSVAAWDVADHGIGLGRQVGREAETARNELVHAVGSLAVGSVSGAVAFGVYFGAAGGQPATALVFLLVGGVALLLTLRE